MRKSLIGALGVWMVAGAVLAAADFWEEKDFTTWSAVEIEELLGDSPWAKVANVRIEDLKNDKSKDAAEGGREYRGGARVTVQRGGFSTDDGWGNGPEGLRSNFDPSQQWRGGRGNQEAMAKAMQVVVWWPSALPVKQAVIRRALSEDGVGGDARIPKEQQDFLDQNEGHYIVSMTGFPPQYSRMIKSRPLMQGTSLNFNKRRPIYPDNVEVYLVDGTVTVLSYFPKDNPITLRDKELEFISQVLDVQVKRKFRLRDMVYAGQLML